MDSGTSWILTTVAGCRSAAEALLGSQGDRWRHVRAVADLAAEIATLLRLDPARTSLLVRGAWLHDIGYAERLRVTGFHPLDGARWLRARGQERLARLVAHHSAADVAARLRGLSLAEFPSVRGGVARLLDYADLCTSPGGKRVTPSERLAEVLRRYPPGNPVHEATLLTRPKRLLLAARVEAELAVAAGAAPESGKP